MNALKNAYNYYVGSFSGFGREVWLLTIASFVNRAGTMVVPFLSLYLTKDMGLTLEEVGWVMSAFGAGSVVGSWLGGKLADRIGHRTVMIGALITSGMAFIGLQYVHGLVPFSIGVFVLLVLSDTFRPALFVALRHYAPPDQRTRAVVLIRLAINLGFSMGPAIGGFIILHWSFAGLFWVDAMTCIAAALVLSLGLPSLPHPSGDGSADARRGASPYRDRPYLLFLAIVTLVTIPFLQYFSSVPLFYSKVHGLSEAYIGLLLGANGLLIFLTEMPLVRYVEERAYSLHAILRTSVVLIALSFVVLDLFPTAGFLWVGMVFLTVGEMLLYPFTNRMANERADRGNPGAYMGLYTVSWSIAHIVGHNLGLNLIDRVGFSTTWWSMTGVLIMGVVLLYALQFSLEREQRTAR